MRMRAPNALSDAHSLTDILRSVPYAERIKEERQMDLSRSREGIAPAGGTKRAR